MHDMLAGRRRYRRRRVGRGIVGTISNLLGLGRRRRRYHRRRYRRRRAGYGYRRRRYGYGYRRRRRRYGRGILDTIKSGLRWAAPIAGSSALGTIASIVARKALGGRRRRYHRRRYGGYKRVIRM